MAQIVIADVQAFDPFVRLLTEADENLAQEDASLLLAEGVTVLNFATQGYTTGSYSTMLAENGDRLTQEDGSLLLCDGLSTASGTTDIDQNRYYEGCIQQPANVQRWAFAPNSTVGRSQIGYGSMVLVNKNGALDYLLDYGFSGRNITIKLGEVNRNDAGQPSFTTIISGTMEQAEFSWDKVNFRVRDRQQDLAKPLQQNRFAGNNSLPNGLEGVASDIGGKPKPIVFGKVFNAPLPLVNSTRLIYQAHDGSALQSVDAVYERGAALTAGAAYSSQADMETNAPAAGQYRVWNSAAGCFIRLGSNASGTVTADLTQGATTADRTAARIWNAILTKAGIPAANISSSDVSALAALATYEVGLFCDTSSDLTALEACDIVMRSVGAWFVSDAFGVFRCGRLDVPTGASVGTISATEITQIERMATNDPGVGVPSWKVKLGYQKIWQVQNDLTASVTAARKGFLSQEYRRVEVSDADTLVANVTSPEIEFLTTIAGAADASTEATRRLGLYKTRRDMLQVRVRVDPALAAVLDIGKIVTVQVNRYGLSSGKKFFILGIRTDMRGRVFDLTLWG